MTDIVVQRGNCDSQGEDVVDSLLSTDHAAMARGRVELDSGESTHPVSLECMYRSGLMVGQVAELYDPFFGGVRYGKITMIQHRVEGVSVYTTLRVQVPSEFAV